MFASNFAAVTIPDIAAVLQEPLPELIQGLPDILVATLVTLQHVDDIWSVTVESTIDLDRVVVLGGLDNFDRVDKWASFTAWSPTFLHTFEESLGSGM